MSFESVESVDAFSPNRRPKFASAQNTHSQIHMHMYIHTIQKVLKRKDIQNFHHLFFRDYYNTPYGKLKNNVAEPISRI